MDLNSLDFHHLTEAVQIAGSAAHDGEYPYGSLLAGADGQELRREHNTTLSTGDITAHPELKLARWAALHLRPEQRVAATMYTSCQPCIMCANVIARAGLGRVVFSLSMDQLRALQPDGLTRPDAYPVTYIGPNTLAASAEPIRSFYQTRDR